MVTYSRHRIHYHITNNITIAVNNYWRLAELTLCCETMATRSRNYEDCCLLGCDAVQYGMCTYISEEPTVSIIRIIDDAGNMFF
jgi:hypothetical protein